MMSRIEEMVNKIKQLAQQKSKIRNMGIVAHIDHGKTTLSDNLLAGAGMISETLAGSQLFMDFDAQEQERGITIYAANVSMVHNYEGEDYLINMIDTPGHVDFGGDVTRAMRAVDGVIVVVDAVEGVMPQTEVVLKQALKEKVKPVLFINKMDRLIKELKLTPEQMQERLIKIITSVNNLIERYAPEEFKKEWQVDVKSGKVAFGSAYRKWALSLPYMQKTGITFKDIIEYTNAGKEDELSQKAKVHEVVLDMVVKHLPSPDVAQKYRIERIWTGDINSEEAKYMINTDDKGPLIAVITNITFDPHAGSIVTARIFSGTLREGQEVYDVNNGKKGRVQQVGVFMGPKRIAMDAVPAGNIVAITGLSEVSSGDTICDPNIRVAPFEEIKHVFEPVVTKSIEVKNVKELPKIIEILKQRAREDPTIKVKVSEDTGEILVSGLGELHIEAKIERFLKDRGYDIIVSPPIVIYKESVLKESRVFEGKSPNKHNKFYIKVMPLEKEVQELLRAGEVPQGKIREQDKQWVAQKLMDAGMDQEESKRVIYTRADNVLVNMTRGIVQLNEVIELIMEAMRQVIDEGPLAHEPVMGVKVMLMDAKLHEDAIHRGPAQVYPAVRLAIRNGMIDGEARLFEPKQIVRIDTPGEYMGDVIKEVQNRRGQVIEINEEEGTTIIIAKIPVAEMQGFEGALKSATAGKGFQSLIDLVYEKLPEELQEKTIMQIRQRKGMPLEMPKIEEE